MTDHLMVHLSGEIHIKSTRTRRRFRRMVMDRVKGALRARKLEGRILDQQGRIHLLTGGLTEAAETISHIFGVHRITHVVPIAYESLDQLADQVADLARERITDRIFAVRVRRRGRQGWTSEDAMRAIGGRLFPSSRGVDLTNPEEEVRVEIYADVAYLVAQTWPGPSGLPLGSQDRCLALISGGFDSPVAAWLLMRRGSPVDFVHFKLECSASEQATVVAQSVWAGWGWGTRPLLWMIDFQGVKEALLEHVDGRLRQVVLKQLMFIAADALAERLGIHVLVTGEAVGQVSSQTMSHLAAIDSVCNRTVLRPLAGSLKEEIIDWARRIGTEAISSRAVEVCDLSDGPVAVSARWRKLAEAHERLPDKLIEDALATMEVTSLRDWLPGSAFAPVVPSPPDDVPQVDPSDGVPAEGSIALMGPKAARVGAEQAARGREVWVVLRPADEMPEGGQDPCP